MTIYGSRRTTQPVKKAIDYDLRKVIYDNNDRYQSEKASKDIETEKTKIRSGLANTMLQGLRGKVPEAKDMTFFNTAGGDLIAAWNDPSSPDQRSFFIVDTDDEDNVSLVPAFSLPESNFAAPLSALNTDWVDRKTLIGMVPQFKTLDPAAVEAVRGMYDESEAGFTPKAVYRRAMEEPVWALEGISAVPGRETAPRIGKMPAATRIRWRTKAEVSPDTPPEIPVEEEVKEEVKTEEPVKAEPAAKPASDLFTEMREVRKSRGKTVTDEAGNIDIVKSSTSSLFKSRMRGSK